MYFFLFLFVTYTLPMAVTESPFNDSAWAWCLAKIVNFSNFVDMLHVEGHCIIWYLILKPFAVNNFWYPYSMQIINWLFCFAAVFFMWKKAPFDNYVKAIITFSVLFSNTFAVVARCYSIGVLGLFLLVHYKKDSLKHPFLYTMLLSLTANTSVMAAIPAFLLSCIYIADIYRNRASVNKMKIFFSLLLLAGGFLFFIFPHVMPPYHASAFCREFVEACNFLTLSFIPDPGNYFFLIAFIATFAYILFVGKGNDAKVFLLSSFLLLLNFLIFIHNGTITHKLFFLVLIILAVWLQNAQEKYSKHITIFYFILITLLYYPLPVSELRGKHSYKYLGRYMQTSRNLFSGSDVIVEDLDTRYILLPYVQQNPDVGLLENSEDFKFHYKMLPQLDMSNEDDIERLKNYARSNNKKLYLISNTERNDMKPLMIFKFDIFLYVYELTDDVNSED